MIDEREGVQRTMPKASTGRPKQFDVMRKVMLSADDDKLLRACAADAGVSDSEILRRCLRAHGGMADEARAKRALLADSPARQAPDAQRRVLFARAVGVLNRNRRSRSRVENNFNQLVRKVNAGQVVETDEMTAALDRLAAAWAATALAESKIAEVLARELG